MSEYFPLRGICLACQSGATCDVHQSRALLECASFESLNHAPVEFTARYAPFYRDVSTLHGLCRDCELRASCADAYRTGGVWTCEQYR